MSSAELMQRKHFRVFIKDQKYSLSHSDNVFLILKHKDNIWEIIRVIRLFSAIFVSYFTALLFLALPLSGCSIFENCKRCNNGTWGPRDDFFISGEYCAECRPGWSGGDCMSESFHASSLAEPMASL